MDDTSEIRTYYDKMAMDDLVKEHAKLAKAVKSKESSGHHLAIMERVMILRGMVFSFTEDDNVIDYNFQQGRGRVAPTETGSTDNSPVTTIDSSQIVTGSARDFYVKWLESPVSKADHPEWS